MPNKDYQISAEIICVGTELLMGSTVNTNAAYIGRRLAELGINIYHQTVVGDNPERLKNAVYDALGRSDMVITTGGLGPTYDDLTKETIASFFGLPLVTDDKALAQIEEMFRGFGRPMTDNNKKQAMLPQGAVVFYNKNGTAPGCMIEKDGKTAFMLPGPPREMAPMFEAFVAPELLKRVSTKLVSRNLYFFGIGESALESTLSDIIADSVNPTVAPYAKTGEVMLRVTARSESEEKALKIITPMIEKISDRVGEFIYGVDVGSIERALVLELMKSGLQIAVIEGCTGGLLAKRITDVDEGDGVLALGVVSIKGAFGLLEINGASAESAKRLATEVSALAGAKVGLSVLGSLQPGGENCGTVYVGVAYSGEVFVKEFNFNRRDDDAKDYMKTLAASNAINEALCIIRGKKLD